MAASSTPWLMRTYSGHSSAARSPTSCTARTSPRARRVCRSPSTCPPRPATTPTPRGARRGRPRRRAGRAPRAPAQQLFDGIPMADEHVDDDQRDRAVALGLYLALAEERASNRARLAGTTQNDIVKEYLSAAPTSSPPSLQAPHRRHDRLHRRHAPKWNPINVCSYHLQEAGATPGPGARLRPGDGDRRARRRARLGQGRPDAASTTSSGGSASSSTPGSASSRRWRRCAPSPRLWDQICRTRYGVEDPALRRFRYGVQVNSLGLTEQQPENNVTRIVLEMLGVTLSATRGRAPSSCRRGTRRSGCRGPGTSSGACAPSRSSPTRPTCSSTRTSSRGPRSWRPSCTSLAEGAREELDDVLALGGAFAAIEELKARLVASQARRVSRIESGEQVVVGVNRFTETAASPLTVGGGVDAVLTVDPRVERDLAAEVVAWRAARDRRRGAARARRAAPRRGERRPGRQRHGRDPRAGARRRHDRRVDRRAARGLRRLPRADRRARGRRRARTRVRRAGRTQPRHRRAPRRARRDCWWPSPASTGTPTAPSRSPWPRATPASRSSTPGSGSRPRRSSPRRATRTSTSWGSRSSRARTCRSSRASSSSWPPRGVRAPVVVGGIVSSADAATLREAGRRRGLHA